MAKRMISMLVAMFLILGSIFGFKFLQMRRMGQAMAAQRPPPTTVSAEAAREEVWHPALRTTGSLVAVQGVTLSNELAGVVASIAFESGDIVPRGALVIQLNTETDEAQLRSFEAAAELGRQTLGRAKVLRESNVNAQAELDAAQAQYDQALANADLARATIAKKTIRAPFAGRLGIRQVNLGQYLPAGTMIVSLQSLDPVYVNFALPQQDLGNVQTGQAVDVVLDTFPDESFHGKVNAFDARLDDATRTVRVQATLANPDGRLHPGMFGNVNVLLPAQEKVVTVPQSAITYNPYGNVVYVVERSAAPAPGETEPALKVRQQFVKLGSSRGDQVSIVSGVKVGDQIVTTGQLKLRDGVPVRVDNSVPASNNPNPKPPNA